MVRQVFTLTTIAQHIRKIWAIDDITITALQHHRGSFPEGHIFPFTNQLATLYTKWNKISKQELFREIWSVLDDSCYERLCLQLAKDTLYHDTENHCR